jgi:hypothetical protein
VQVIRSETIRVVTGGAGQPPSLPGYLAGLRFELPLGRSRTPPCVVQPPANPGIVLAADSVQRTVQVGGTGPLTYQWRRNGIALPNGTSAAAFGLIGSATPGLACQWLHQRKPIAGATELRLRLSFPKASQAGDYQAVVSSGAGAVTTRFALLEIVQPANLETAGRSLSAAPRACRVDNRQAGRLGEGQLPRVEGDEEFSH